MDHVLLSLGLAKCKYFKSLHFILKKLVDDTFCKEHVFIYRFKKYVEKSTVQFFTCNSLKYTEKFAN